MKKGRENTLGQLGGPAVAPEASENIPHWMGSNAERAPSSRIHDSALHTKRSMNCLKERTANGSLQERRRGETGEDGIV